MKLLTKEIEKKIPKLRSGEYASPELVKIAVKFFTPWTNWTWYAVEGERQEDGDFLFYGLVEGFEKEYGYFSLNELEAIEGPSGLKIERDMYFGSKTLADIEKGNQ